jgi:hypothetical protein
VQKTDPLRSFFSVFLVPKYLSVLTPEHASMIGAGVDELLRHYPTYASRSDVTDNSRTGTATGKLTVIATVSATDRFILPSYFSLCAAFRVDCTRRCA